jgi:hypothetical protein
VKRRPLVPGWCLRCGNSTKVVWIGPVEHNGQTAPAYFCEPCCEAVRDYISSYNQQWDARPAS